jgi:hypothetical protein
MSASSSSLRWYSLQDRPLTTADDALCYCFGLQGRANAVLGLAFPHYTGDSVARSMVRCVSCVYALACLLHPLFCIAPPLLSGIRFNNTEHLGGTLVLSSDSIELPAAPSRTRGALVKANRLRISAGDQVVRYRRQTDILTDCKDLC